jgi:hypothetical protein
MTQFGVGQSPLPAFDRELANALSRIFADDVQARSVTKQTP